MENDFFELYERHKFLNVEIGHNQVADWCLELWDRKGDNLGERRKKIITIQHCDRKKVFAKAYELLAEYLSETYGGY